MDERQFGRNIALLRREVGLTQDRFAQELHVSPQAVSKWENGHSLPESALLPDIARLLEISLDELFGDGGLSVIEALFGDGIETVNVTRRLMRLIEKESLRIPVSGALLGADSSSSRAAFLTVRYQSRQGVCRAVFPEGGEAFLSSEDAPTELPYDELRVIAGCYGTKARRYDVMPKIEHYRAFNWNAYHANHELFPSDPANDETEYLTLVYLNRDGIHMSTCAEGESLTYSADKTELVRAAYSDECYIPDVPELPPFGSDMECSWAASLTAALQAMGVETDYTEVMGVSGACYRLAFCVPEWDYSSVDGLVAYDYAAPGYAAYGFTPETHSRVEKTGRAAHRERIMEEIRDRTPVIGINLRVAPEWGVICGYRNGGEDLFCRTKYDRDIFDGDPAFVRGALNPYDYLYVDNWPYLFSYFTGKCNPPSAKDNLIASLGIFLDCAATLKANGYHMGFKAYEAWAEGLRDEFYRDCGDEVLARRFSINQFCALSLLDARTAAHEYLDKNASLLEGGGLREITCRFEAISKSARTICHMLGSNAKLTGADCRAFWTEDKRHAQARLLDEMSALEREAYALAKAIVI